MTVLLVDNYDSFTHNLFQALAGLGASVAVHRNDRITLDDAILLEPTHIVLSPGPGRPERARDFGVCAALIAAAETRRLPLLGVCLGHQGLAFHFGARIVRAPTIMHGKASAIRHGGDSIFAGLPDGFEAMRYHSLTVDPKTVPDALEVTARTDDGVVMGVHHRSLPMVGMQFHPESIGTPLGPALLERFLELS